jgi:predicted RNA-binding Zn-ribbon protein involved in translation (DUF1610 family)
MKGIAHTGRINSPADGFADAIRRRKESAMNAVCPKCGEHVKYIIIDEIGIGRSAESAELEGVVYLCPLCRAILGVGWPPSQQVLHAASQGHRGSKKS